MELKVTKRCTQMYLYSNVELRIATVSGLLMLSGQFYFKFYYQIYEVQYKVNNLSTSFILIRFFFLSRAFAFHVMKGAR